MPFGGRHAALGYSFDHVRDDGNFVLYRAHVAQTALPSVLLLTPPGLLGSAQSLKNQILTKESSESAIWAAAGESPRTWHVDNVRAERSCRRNPRPAHMSLNAELL
jgi:hypothetical protein